MHLSEAIKLIEPADYAPGKPAKWADLGCGTGLFTQALASRLSADSLIYAVDTNQAGLTNITSYKDITIEPVRLDFVQDDWPFEALDGLLMANALHFVKDKLAFLQKAKRYLTESSSFLLVEYDTDTPNPWVPYPLSYPSLKRLFNQAGYLSVKKLHEKPSIYQRANLYSAYIT